MKPKDEKQPEENTELVKEVDDPKPGYIFQKNGITKTGFLIIVVVIILAAIGVVLSGLFFEAQIENPM